MVSRLIILVKHIYFFILCGALLNAVFVSVWIGAYFLNETTGLFYHRVEKEIICTTLEKSDGKTRYHGESYYQRPTLSQLIELKDSCELRQKKDEPTDRFYEPDMFGDLFSEDCSTVGETHRDDFWSKRSKECVGVANDSRKIQVSIQRHRYVPNYLPTVYVLSSYLVTILAYMIGYVVFGYVSLSPIKLWRLIRKET